MRMFGAGPLRTRALRGRVAELAAGYGQPLEASGRLAWQLDRFNTIWPDIRRGVPFYRDLGASVPDRFSSWEQVAEFLPCITKETVQQNRAALTDGSRQAQFWRITGGSTAQPVQIPAWRDENEALAPDRWLARSWYGILPGDSLFLIWGHSHLMGSGVRGWYNARLRQLKDFALSYRRFSAYDMSPAAMDAAGRELEKFRPRYIYGYSVALDQFARVNLQLGRDFRHLELKAVIAAAEAFPSEDSAALLHELTGAPVTMEYGSVETELVAHLTPQGYYQVFWKSYFVEAVEEEESGGGRVLVTSLYPRCFPLIRYDLGDRVSLLAGDAARGPARFERVLGRCNSYLVLSGGERIHSEAITHCLRGVPGIRGYQAIQSGSSIALEFTAGSSVAPGTIEGIRRRLRTVHPDLEQSDIRPVERLRQTIAGKTPMIVR